MRWKRWMGAFVGIGLLQLWMGAQTPQQPAGIEAIQAYAGVWKTEIEHLETAHSKASRERSVLHNSCWKSGAYYACNQYVDGDSKILLVFTYDAKENAYNSYQIPQSGGEAGHGRLLIDGNVWTFPWQTNEGGTTTYFRVVNVFTGSSSIEFRQEFSADKAHWTLMAKGQETKISGE